MAAILSWPQYVNVVITDLYIFFQQYRVFKNAPKKRTDCAIELVDHLRSKFISYKYVIQNDELVLHGD